jgi:IS30 family transposase
MCPIPRDSIRDGGVGPFSSPQILQVGRLSISAHCPCHTCLHVREGAISANLTRKWSPQQIAGWLMREHPDDESKRVSHAPPRSHTYFVCVATQWAGYCAAMSREGTIYRSLFIQTRGALKKEFAHLRSTRAILRSRHATMKRSGLGKFNDAISIHDRPAEVEGRAVPGH